MLARAYLHRESRGGFNNLASQAQDVIFDFQIPCRHQLVVPIDVTNRGAFGCLVNRVIRHLRHGGTTPIKLNELLVDW